MNYSLVTISIRLIRWPLLFICIYMAIINRTFAHDGTINITGNILAASCTVAVGDQNKSVAIGDFSTGTLTDVGQKTKFVPFTISLFNCSSGVSGTTLLLSGNADVDNSTLLQLNNPGAPSSASGVAVLLADNFNNSIDINDSSRLQALSAGSNIITLKLAYQVTKTPVTAGDASAVMFLDLNYQ